MTTNCINIGPLGFFFFRTYVKAGFGTYKFVAYFEELYSSFVIIFSVEIQCICWITFTSKSLFQSCIVVLYKVMLGWAELTQIQSFLSIGKATEIQRN